MRLRLDWLDWHYIGFILVLAGGVFSLLFGGNGRMSHPPPVEAYLGYIIGSGLSLAVIAGAIMANRGHFAWAYPLILVPSALSTLRVFLVVALLTPESVVARVVYYAIAGTGYLGLSLVGGIIILIAHSKALTPQETTFSEPTGARATSCARGRGLRQVDEEVHLP